MKTVSALAAIALALLVYFFLQRPITYPPGVLIESDPKQTTLEVGLEPVAHGEYKLKPLARFSLDARILHRKIYRFDRESGLVPVDLALGWGPMSDQSVLDKLRISQSMRFYWYEYQLPPPIPREEIISHSTNVHVIPASNETASFCKSVRQGELVHLEGELVEATGPAIGTWRSSLSRTDTGNGACELMLVESGSRINPSELRHLKMVKR
jgi:hypothetical protein